MPKDEGPVTDFFRKNTRHSTPLFVMGLAFVGVAALVCLKRDVELLALKAAVTWYDVIGVLVDFGIVTLTALGGFMNSTYKDERNAQQNKPTP